MGTVNQHANISGYFLFLSTLIMLFVSCGNDDNGTVVTPIPVENTAPSIQNQDFTVAEGIADADAIGTVTATDADNDALSFSITQNDNDLFAITEGGELSLTDSASLDFETAESHTITVEVTDGTDTASATVTINVTEVDETSFITKWETSSANETVTIPINTDFSTYDYTVDWGDGKQWTLVQGLDII